MTDTMQVYKPHGYQQAAHQHIIANPGAGLFLDMGLGKTVVTLTAIRDLMYNRFEIAPGTVLIVAPKRVAEQGWPAELGKWQHLSSLTMTVIRGTEAQRMMALRRRTDMYVISRDNIAWLCALYRDRWPFTTVVLDELSSFKSSDSMRFRALRKIRPLMSRVIGLTGTPSGNGLTDLWAQLYLLDEGKRLGDTVTRFREAYCSRNYNGFGYTVNDTCAAAIKDRIRDICISMKASDYLQLPPRHDVTVEVELNETTYERYRKFEREQIMQMVTEAGSVHKITAFNAGALYNKLLQFSNGAVYDANRQVHAIHDEKLEALDEIIDVATSPVMVFYAFEHDRDRMMKRYKGARLLNTTKDIEDWNAGKIPVLILHPASAGHGLNLQDGGNVMVWFGLTWSLELYQQACARLHRQGQTRPVIIHHLVTRGTMDEKVIERLSMRGATQDDLMEAVKARVHEILGSTAV